MDVNGDCKNVYCKTQWFKTDDCNLVIYTSWAYG